MGTPRRPSPATAISIVALVVATAGGAYAAVNGSEIIAGTVQTSKLSNGAVTRPKIRNSAVGSNQLAPFAVTTSRIAPGAVGTAALADGAVTRDALVQRAVGARQIGLRSISRANLSAEASVPRVVTRVSTTEVPINTTGEARVACQPGEVVVGGGFGGIPNTVGPGGTQAAVLANRPDPLITGSTPLGWYVAVENLSTQLATVFAYVLCAQPT
jgi:hypothetical protein